MVKYSVSDTKFLSVSSSLSVEMDQELRSDDAFFIFIKIDIQKALVDFFAINIFVKCERNFGYLLLLCHKPLETTAFNPLFYEPLRSIKLNWKSIKFL